MTIKNPVEWTYDQARIGLRAAGAAGRSFARPPAAFDGARPLVRRLSFADLRDCLALGFQDFRSYRTDLLFIGIVYPLAGLLLARVMLGYDMLPLVFPLVAGFALIGPLAATGLYEMSRRREQGGQVTWIDAFEAFRSPAIGEIVKFGVALLGVFLLWMIAAALIYGATLGWQAPETPSAFLAAVLTTPAGWALIVIGGAVGFGFALMALAIGVVTVPLLLDRNVDASTAISTSIAVMRGNPGPILAWGALVATLLAAGAVPLLLGLIVVMPVLGHATWHLYRRAVW
ncbi:DUF2189 domain-containing protein [Aquabacter spiritensis]|uniref:Putative membrane protein n=1 Tax=Aquabacter spiritensis TaxID=933073 RepID=A0A4V2UXI3_9HYPH|nr:DUF2189 domain-containing protein [Aquabacter spiritensis]TCT03548.1 putative membrane protein [Aquabacter spiritensis]